MSKIDIVVNGVSLVDAIKKGDAPAAVAAFMGFGSGLNGKNLELKPISINASAAALIASMVIVTDKIVSGKGLTVSDMMATHAAYVGFAGSAIDYGADAVEDKFKDKKVSAALEGLASISKKIATAEAATALTMSKTKADIAVYDPQGKTGLPKINDFDGSRETWDKIGKILAGNVDKETQDAQRIAREFGGHMQAAQEHDIEAHKAAVQTMAKVFAKYGEHMQTAQQNDIDAHKAAADLLTKTFEQFGKHAQQGQQAENDMAKAAADLFKDLFNKLPEMTEKLFDPFFRWVYEKTGGWEGGIPEWAREWLGLPQRSGHYHIVDPLVLDLDGDGIETLAAAGFSGSLFDHDKDGIRTATGWLKGDDGFLVRDLNGNGSIDHGGELFGDHTVLKNGALAQHGYEALKDLDDNADGRIDAADAAFASLRIWQDANQDGISQTSELALLRDHGIAALNLAYQDTDQALGNGNRIAQAGSYVRTDGGSARMGDLLLANDTVHSRYADPVSLTAEQFQAANLTGIGRLRDLREAVLCGRIAANDGNWFQAA